MDWEKSFIQLYNEFVEGKYINEEGVKHISRVYNGKYSIYISVEENQIIFEVLFIENFSRIMSLYCDNGIVKKGVGIYEKYVDKAVSILTLDGMGVL